MSFDSLKTRLGREPMALVKIDLDTCANVYGSAPCTAAGSSKCFNTFATCQDTPNFTTGTKSYWFTEQRKMPPDLVAYPCIKSIRYAPTTLAPGKGLGARGSITVTLQDFPHHDRSVDPYVSERSYEAREQGTFFGKLKARNPYYIGRQLVLYEGFLGGAFNLSNFRARYYVIESISLSNATGTVTIIAKDILKLADNDRAQCPVPTTGTLAGALDSSATSFSVSSGDGAQYTDGERVIIGDEIITVGTWTADAASGCTRGVGGTTAVSHAASDTVQQCKSYTAEPVIDILQDLLTTFAGIDSTYIPTAEWETEESLSLATFNLTTIIAKPTGVKKLIEEILQQCLLDLWFDEVDNEIKLAAQTPWTVDAGTVTDDSNIIAGTMRVRDKPSERVSRVLFYHGIRNYAGDLDKAENFDRSYLAIQANRETPETYGQSAVREIYSRWWAAADQTQVSVVVGRILDRFRDIPVESEFDLDVSDSELRTGDVVSVSSRMIQAADGSNKSTRMQIIETMPKNSADLYSYRALQYHGNPSDSLTIAANVCDYNVATALSNPTTAVDVTVEIGASATVGGSPAFSIGSLPPNSVVNIINNGNIYGDGGAGGVGGLGEAMYFDEDEFWRDTGRAGVTGGVGGDAIEVPLDSAGGDTITVTIENNGNIFGGGGGGGGGRGWGDQPGVSGDPNAGDAAGGHGGGGGQGGENCGGGVGGTGGSYQFARDGGGSATGTGSNGNNGTTGDTSAAGTGGTGGTSTRDGGDGGAWGADGDDAPAAYAGVMRGGSGGYAVRKNGNDVTFSNGNNATQVKGAVDD